MTDLVSLRADGYPGTTVRATTAGGRILYLEVEARPVVLAAALRPDDVAALVRALSTWLVDQAEEASPTPFTPPPGSPLVGGVLGRVLADAGRARTVQPCTVHTPDQGEYPGYLAEYPDTGVAVAGL